MASKFGQGPENDQNASGSPAAAVQTDPPRDNANFVNPLTIASRFRLKEGPGMQGSRPVSNKERASRVGGARSPAALQATTEGEEHLEALRWRGETVRSAIRAASDPIARVKMICAADAFDGLSFRIGELDEFVELLNLAKESLETAAAAGGSDSRLVEVVAAHHQYLATFNPSKFHVDLARAVDVARRIGDPLLRAEALLAIQTLPVAEDLSYGAEASLPLVEIEPRALARWACRRVRAWSSVDIAVDPWTGFDEGGRLEMAHAVAEAAGYVLFRRPLLGLPMIGGRHPILPDTTGMTSVEAAKAMDLSAEEIAFLAGSTFS